MTKGGILVLENVQSMGLFGPDPHVSKREMKEVKSALHHHGFTQYEIDDVVSAFRGDLEEHDGGITKHELERGMKWLHQNKSKHRLSDDQLKTVEEALRKRL